MASLTFLGAAGTVTGSQYLLEVNDQRVLVDCGMFQGKREEAARKNQTFAFNAGKLDAVVLSHAHIDHSGTLPMLHKNGYRGRIYTTTATHDLCGVMLLDSANIQQRIYGRMAADDEDPGYFAYPFYTVFVLLPLVFTGYAWASAIWMVALEACLVTATVLLLDLYGWRPRPGLLGVLLLWTLSNYYGARGLLLGQPGLLVYGLHVLALWAFARRRDALAGAALALSTIKPQMGFLLIPFLLLVGLSLRRWRFLAAFAGEGLILLGLSFALVPTWLGDWLAQIAAEGEGARPQQVKQRFSMFTVVAGLVVIGLLIVIGYALWQRSRATPTEGRAPDFAVTMYAFDQMAMSGESVTLKDLRGQAVVVNFWASYCVPCQKEAPLLERVWNDFRERGVIFLGINTEDPLKEALDYLVKYGVTYPNAPDQGGRMENAYRITGIPETFVINTQGEIVRHFLSEPNERELRNAIERALEG